MWVDGGVVLYEFGGGSYYTMGLVRGLITVNHVSMVLAFRV